MDDGIEDAARRARGSIKEAIGILIGDRVIEAEGAAEKAPGRTSSRHRRSDDPINRWLTRAAEKP